MTSLAREAFVGGMNDRLQSSDGYRLTSTQIGAIGESVVAVGLTLTSQGRLAPFKPFADDDGIDLLIYDKETKRALPIQVIRTCPGDISTGESTHAKVWQANKHRT